MQKLAIALSLAALMTFIVACGANSGGGSTGTSVATGKTIKSAPAGNNLTVTLSTEDGVLRHGSKEFMLAFTDASGKPVDVGAVALTFHMPQMGSMQAMNNAATFTTTETPGVYRGKANIEMAGEWQAQITYEGPAGTGKASFPVTAQ